MTIVNSKLDPRADFEIEFQDIHIRASENWSFIQALRECFFVSLPSLQSALVPYLEHSVRTTMGDAFPPISDRANQEVLRLMAAQKEEFARSVIDAATVAIVQATLDSAINQYLVLLAQAEPAIWEADLKKEPVPLGELRGTSYGALLSTMALGLARALSNKSLPAKVQLVLDRCYRGDIELSPPGFRFDMKRLRAFDDTRHDVAHGRGMGITISNMDELLRFLWQTLLSVENVIAARLCFKRNPARELAKARELKLRNVAI
jgi:hypothetical protein